MASGELRDTDSSIDFPFNGLLLFIGIMLIVETRDGGIGVINGKNPMSEEYIRNPTPMFSN